MAQRTHIVVEDDITGGLITDNDAPTVTFALDGTTYEIDLNDKNQEKLRKALAPYVAAGRKVGKAPARRGAGKAASTGPKPSEVREWAVAQGMDVPARGRIPLEVSNAYEAAH